MSKKTLRSDRLEAAKLADYVDVEVSPAYVSISRYYKAEWKKPSMDMILLDKEEALALLDFLKENEEEINKLP